MVAIGSELIVVGGQDSKKLLTEAYKLTTGKVNEIDYDRLLEGVDGSPIQSHYSSHH
jgi:hypothetical protein